MKLHARLVVAAILAFAGSPIASPVAPASAVPTGSALTIDAGRVAGGNGHTCLLRPSGAVWCWGLNTDGQTGKGDAPTTSYIAGPVDGGSLAGRQVARIAAGGNSTCAVDTTGQVSCWGDNSVGQLGNNASGTDSDVPVAVTGGALAGKSVVDIAVGTQHACALDDSGRAYCWGLDSSGQLGDGGGAVNSPVPVEVSTAGALSGKTLTAITAGSASACAIDTDGKAYCWGDNSAGQLGDNDGGNDSADPAAVVAGGVLAGRTLTAISAGGLHVCALADNGKVYCWGENGAGQLGNNDGTNTDLDVPAQADPLNAISPATITDIAAGGEHTCVIVSTDVPWCWGEDSNGQVGDNQNTDKIVPVPVVASGVLAGKPQQKIGAGRYIGCATDADRHAYCWGDDASFQLGDSAVSDDSGVPATVILPPDRPVVTVTPGDGQLTVTWPAVDPGTETLDGYGVMATPGPVGCTPGMSTSCVITGLTNGTAYSVRVTAVWAEGITMSFPVTGTPTVSTAPPPGLAITGDNVAWTVGTGTVILLAGVALVRYGRRRIHSH